MTPPIPSPEPAQIDSRARPAGHGGARPAEGSQPIGSAARLRFGLWVLAVGLLAVGLPAWFYALRGERLVLRTALFVNGWMLLSALCLGVWALLSTTPGDAIRLPQRTGKRIVLVLTGSLVLAGLVFLLPLLSDQALRYRFDGRAWLLGESPYQISPSAAAEAAGTRNDPDLLPDRLDLAAPNQERTSLNLTVSQAGFVASRAVEYLLPRGDAAPASPAVLVNLPHDWQRTLLELPWWRQLLLWRLITAAALLLTVGELVAWLRYRGQSVWWVLVFAWQPLVLVEVLGNGHQDMLGILFLVAALRRADMGRYRRAGISLAASIAVKPLALLVVPFVLVRAWRGEVTLPSGGDDQGRPRLLGPGGSRRAAVWFLAVSVLLFAPLWADGSWRPFVGAAGELLMSPHHDGSLAHGLDRLFLGAGEDPDREQRVRLVAWAICLAGVLVTAVVAWRRRARPSVAFYAMTLVGLLLSPLMPPWLLVWPLAMVPLLPAGAGLTALVWAATATLSYATGPHLPLLELVPVYAAGGVELIVFARSGQRPRLAVATVPG